VPLLKEKLILSYSLGNNYNLPTLNDLYWYQGGNPNLKTEKIIQQESSILYEDKINKKISIQIKSTYYHQKVNDQIQWLPSSTSSLFTPQNIAKVQQEGFQTKLSTTIKPDSHQTIFIQARYNYTHAINTSNPLETTYGKQIHYQPLHTTSLLTSYSYKSWTLLASHQYFSKRFTTSDNQIHLVPYQLYNLQLDKKISIQKVNLNLSLACNNLLNTHYEAIQWYPMMGRYLELRVRVVY
jgi:iron complex outermembrane receptor protein